MVLEKIFFKLANHKQELPMAAMAILYRFQWRRFFFLEIDLSERRITYGGHVCKRIGMK
jgi:hypothetical protein